MRAGRRVWREVTCMTIPGSAEWLEADGQGGFASGPVTGPRTRRYHALLLAASDTTGARFVLVNGLDAAIETPVGAWVLSSQSYTGAKVSPDLAELIESFSSDPWPTWIYCLPDGTRVRHEIFCRPGAPQVFLSWRLDDPAARAILHVRPFLSGRDYHALHHENPSFTFAPAAHADTLVWRPYPGVPAIRITASGTYRHEPYWYRGFFYGQESARGLDCDEDLVAPGAFTFDLGAGEAALVLAAGDDESPRPGAMAWLGESRAAERIRRAAFASPLHRAADAYIVRRGDGKSIIAGYPWFTDWGRDTFIAMRGLCLATGRLGDARAILLRWAGTISEGMLPNRFRDGGEPPEYNSVDAALWFIVAVFEYLMAAVGPAVPSAADRTVLVAAVEAILLGYTAGTRHRIGATPDGLLGAGEPGVQLTWMDAKVGDDVITPRIGKPVEIQALWLNALFIGAELRAPSAQRWRQMYDLGRRSFTVRFTGGHHDGLPDIVDVDHCPGTIDRTLRPNQIFAVGGLPLVLLDGARARAVVDAVEAHLLTPLGLRSLSPDEPAYCPRYEGGVRERDGAYHQGTVWPWLLGAFVEAWVRVRGGGPEVRQVASERFAPALRAHLGETGFGHICEIADADPPHTPRGCPFQAWSLGEFLRLQRLNYL